MIKYDTICPKIAAVVLIVTDDNKFVAVSRKDDSTKFGFPGGKLDNGESVENTVIREISEELQFDLQSDKLVPIFSGMDSGNWAVAFLYLDVLSREHIEKLVPEENTIIRTLSREQLSDRNVSPFAEYNIAAFAGMDNFVFPETHKKYRVEVKSWENDGDHYSTQVLNVSTIEEARFLKELFNAFNSCNDSDDSGFGNTNIEIPVLREFFEDLLEQHPASIKFSNIFKDVSDELDDDSIQDVITQLLGVPVDYEWGFFADGPFCRVADSFDMYHVNHQESVTSLI
jgi:8-oxo-dGTP pyrophosphatase MutT (NUDIX family)